MTAEGLALLQQFRTIEEGVRRIFAEDLSEIEKLIGSDPQLPRHWMEYDRWRQLSPARLKIPNQVCTTKSTIANSIMAKLVAFDRGQVELKAGTILCREWNGITQRAIVVDDGFLWDGTRYDSLSAIAFAITGTRWSGPRFFGLRDGTVAGEDGP